MKMTSSTSSTSMSGVTFMSAAGVRDLGLDDLVGAEMMMRVCHYCASRRRRRAFLRSVMRPMSSMPACAELVHRRHHGAVLDLLVGLDEDDLLLLVLEQLVDLRRQLAFAEPAWRSGRRALSVRDRDDRLVLRLGLVDACWSPSAA